jgi:hypothetical protein
MKAPRSIERDGYCAIDWQPEPDLFLTDIWNRFPELVVGRYLVNTSYDSGFVTLSEDERTDGWYMLGHLAHSPSIRSIDQVPHDQYDEWLVFDHPFHVHEFDTMVNHTGFTPIDFGWEEKRERFWQQVIRLQPLHVLGENDGIYLLSRDKSLVQRISEAKFGA